MAILEEGAEDVLLVDTNLLLYILYIHLRSVGKTPGEKVANLNIA